MTAVNPGPATSGFSNSMLEVAPVNSQVYGGNFIGANGLRCLGQARAVNANAAADTPIPIVNSTKWTVYSVLVTNASTTSVTSAYGGVFTATNAGGTTIAATAQLTTLSSTSVVKFLTVTTASTAAVTATQIYFNVTTVAGTTATFDVYVMGYDLT